MAIFAAVMAVVGLVFGVAAFLATLTRRSAIATCCLIALCILLGVLSWFGFLDWAAPLAGGRALAWITVATVAATAALVVGYRRHQARRWRDLRWPDRMTPVAFGKASRHYFAGQGWDIVFERADRWKFNYFLTRADIKLGVIFASVELQRSYPDERIATQIVSQHSEARRVSRLPILFISNFRLKPREAAMLHEAGISFWHYSELAMLDEMFPIATDRLPTLPPALIDLMQKIAPVCDALSKAFLAHGDRPDALAWAQRTVRAAQSDADAHFHLCQLYFDDKNLAAAAEWAEKAFRLLPKRLAFIRKLIEIARAQGDLAQAAAWAEQGIEVHPKIALLPDTLTAIRLAQNDLERAELAARQTLALEPGKIRFYRRLSDILAKRGSLAEAVEIAARAVALEPKDVELRTHLGDLLTQAGQYRQAQDVLEAALALAPDASKTLRGLRVMATKSGNAAQAYAYSERLMAQADRTPADAAIHAKMQADQPAS